MPYKQTSNGLQHLQSEGFPVERYEDNKPGPVRTFYPDGQGRFIVAPLDPLNPLRTDFVDREQWKAFIR